MFEITNKQEESSEKAFFSGLLFTHCCQPFSPKKLIKLVTQSFCYYRSQAAVNSSSYAAQKQALLHNY